MTGRPNRDLFATHGRPEDLGLCTLFANDVATAAPMFEQEFELHVWLGSKVAPFALTDFPVPVMLMGEVERAALLQGATLAIWESIPASCRHRCRSSPPRCSRRSSSGWDSPAMSTCSRGRALDRSAAVALGLEQHAAPDDKEVAEPVSVLSRRENEVAALVAEGLTDREIATRLVISQRTAESHVQDVLSKLGALALDENEPAVAQEAGSASPPVLTRREREGAGLVANGLEQSEIAARPMSLGRRATL